LVKGKNRIACNVKLLFLTDFRSSSHRARLGLSVAGFAFALSLAAVPQISMAAPDDAGNGNAAMQLAAKIASFEAGHDSNPQELVAAYEKVYGKVGTVPDRWPALVRRVLVCQITRDQICVHSSIVRLKQAGSIDTLALSHLFEVSRYGMRVDAIRNHLHVADAGDDDIAAKPVDPPAKTAKPTTTVAESARDMTPVPISAAADPPPAIVAPSVVASASASASIASDPPPKPSAKPATSRSCMQKAGAKLNRLAATDSAGFFLDALFILAALSLLLLYLLYRAARGKSQERRERLRALQEIQRLEELRDQEKIAAEHELWSERLKAEVAIEAQKAHAEDLRRLAQQASDETIIAERELASATIKAERERYEQMLTAEKTRAAETLKIEQAKTDEAVKSARFRADQAIDAYDQMAARELVYAHKHNDDLQEALNSEEARREELETKVSEALQTVEAMKTREKKLLDIIKAEQRVRISESRQAAEKLKAAQQAAVALHQSLVTTRAMKLDLERRAEEAARAAELRVLEARQMASSKSAAEAVAPTRSVTVPEEADLPPATVVLKDVFSR
jgi:hypothetical protein